MRGKERKSNRVIKLPLLSKRRVEQNRIADSLIPNIIYL